MKQRGDGNNKIISSGTVNFLQGRGGLVGFEGCLPYQKYDFAGGRRERLKNMMFTGGCTQNIVY